MYDSVLANVSIVFIKHKEKGLTEDVLISNCASLYSQNKN